MRVHLMIGLGSLLLSGAAALAQPTPPPKAGQDFHNSLREVINTGADLFNAQGDHAGCYRIYQGGLLAIRPALPRDLQQKVNDSLKSAEQLPRYSDKAFALRKILDSVRDWAETQRALWDRLGGEQKVAAVVEEFLRSAAADPRVNVTRDGKVKVEPKVLKKQLIDFISDATGGPFRYEGKDMSAAHRGMSISHNEFDACLIHLSDALDKHKVPEPAANALLNAVEAMRREVVEATGEKGSPKAKSPADDKKNRLAGKVVFDGRPAPPGFVTLVGDGRRFSTSILPDGTFSFRTALPPGEYRVAIERTPGAVIPPNLDIPERYRNENTSGLMVEVKADPQRIDLNLKR